MKWLICRVADFSPAQLARCYETLSPSRKAHIDTFRHEGARQQSLAGELALRQLLAQAGITDIIERAPGGQPVLLGRSAFVSISHCEEFVACAVADTPVGIDIERIRPIKPGLIDRVCTPEEKAYVGDSPARFLEIWTAKEAWFKMQGTGITDFQAVNTLAIPREYHREQDYILHIVCKEKR